MHIQLYKNIFNIMRLLATNIEPSPPPPQKNENDLTILNHV